MKRLLAVLLPACLALASCNPWSSVRRDARTLARDTALRSAQLGIAIRAADGSRSFSYGGDKYFVPASNTKLATCYAALRHLGDSLPALRYAFENDTMLVILPTGDPTFLHPDYSFQPALRFLQEHRQTQTYISEPYWQEDPLGSGWSWNDYEASFMAERSALPLYENLARFASATNYATSLRSIPSYFDSWDRTDLVGDRFSLHRQLGSNVFKAAPGGPFTDTAIPFATNNDSTAAAILRHQFGLRIERRDRPMPASLHLLRSQPTDSLLRTMMHRSDNFFAEQALLMVSNELLGIMNDDRVIDTLLRSDLKGLPQEPRWADGSGLSRYNLFTPRDFVEILARLQRDFGLPRVTNILATGNTGTLTRYYIKEQGRLWAKTGTLSGVVALSGYAYTKKGKLLLFSVLVNNNRSSATAVRRAVERFIESVLEQ